MRTQLEWPAGESGSGDKVGAADWRNWGWAGNRARPSEMLFPLYSAGAFQRIRRFGWASVSLRFAGGNIDELAARIQVVCHARKCCGHGGGCDHGRGIWQDCELPGGGL